METVITAASDLSHKDADIAAGQPTMPWLLANHAIHCFVDSAVVLALPDRIYWCNGSAYERKRLEEDARDGQAATLEKCRPAKFLDSRSNLHVPAQKLRCGHFNCENSTSITDRDENWIDPSVAFSAMHDLFAGCMRGRTLYVVPLVISSPGSQPRVVIQLTDSIEMVLAKTAGSHLGNDAENLLGRSNSFLHCLHSRGNLTQPDQRYICHFPNNRGVWSFGTGVVDGALRCSDCVALGMARA